MSNAEKATKGGATLTIDLGALQRNYLTLAEMAGPSETGAAVKANAYGIGIEHAVPALEAVGCTHFFTALPVEGIEVRDRVKPDVDVFVLNGLIGSPGVYRDHNLTPVIGNAEELARWQAAFSNGSSRPYALHVDTGMSRLGFEVDAFFSAASDGLFSQKPALLMTHMACADDPSSPLNAQQISVFKDISAALPDVPTSLANSASIINGYATGYDLARPGIALYGGRAVNPIDNPMEPVVALTAPIVQKRLVKAGETVGYGATWTATRDTLIAVAPVGYADGYVRYAGAGDHKAGSFGAIGGIKVPIVGRVSMDLTTFDMTDLPASVRDSATDIELIGPTITVDDVADAARTIGYEILTGLSHRLHRVVVPPTEQR